VDEQRVEEPAEVDCNAALDRALSHLGSQIKERNAVVSRDLLPSILAEPYALTLLLQNVISNAIKYSRREIAPRIHVSASRNEGEWVFSVQDNGIGIESGDLDKIFAPFKRLHGKEYPGTGLGLAMCQKIVERYGGRIWAESVAGQGSTFRFTLPVIEVRDETGSNRSD
jgi:signal transduction histidine kinase